MSIDVRVRPSLTTGYHDTRGGSQGDCGCDDSCGLERVKYFPRQLLTAADMTSEQQYFREKQRRHNRYLHGWGVVCGCEVRPAATSSKPFQVMVCPGYVITPHGDEIMIGCRALFDLKTCMVSSDDPCAYSRPCPPVTENTPMRTSLYLTVCYKECDVRPVRVGPVGCGCDDAQCEHSRIRDAYEFVCLDRKPATHVPPPYDCNQLCHGGVFPCPPTPTDGCVVLAAIQINPTATENAVLIDTLTDRRLLYTSAMVQMMALCSCSQLPPLDPPTITQDGTGNNLGTLVEISAQPGATIHYAIGGGDPDTTSPVYTGELEITTFVNGQQTVKALAVAPGHSPSPIASAVITAL
jgi:hypothetical protein